MTVHADADAVIANLRQQITDLQKTVCDVTEQRATLTTQPAAPVEVKHSPDECGRECQYYDYFEMLWNWFADESRRGAEDMRANAANGGLSADDFKGMLDEHESELVADIALKQPEPAQSSAAADDAVEAVIDDMTAAWVGKKWHKAFKEDCSRLVAAARVPAQPQTVLVSELADVSEAHFLPIEEAARFLLDRLDEFDPGEDEPEREYHGHVAPAIARLRCALSRPQEK